MERRSRSFLGRGSTVLQKPKLWLKLLDTFMSSDSTILFLWVSSSVKMRLLPRGITPEKQCNWPANPSKDFPLPLLFSHLSWLHFTVFSYIYSPSFFRLIYLWNKNNHSTDETSLIKVRIINFRFFYLWVGILFSFSPAKNQDWMMPLNVSNLIHVNTVQWLLTYTYSRNHNNTNASKSRMELKLMGSER